MNKPQIFKHPQFGQVEVITIDGNEWFGSTQSAVILGYTNPQKAVRDHCREDGCTIRSVIDSLGRTQQMKFINEGNLYRLITRSKLPEAYKFESWVFDEVLPSIRKHGAYMTPETLFDALSNPDGMIKVLTRLKDEQEARRAAEAKIESDRPKVLFAESLEVSKDSILIGDLAKILKQNGIDIGEGRLFRWMRENGYLIKSGSEYNMPTQRSMDLQIMEIKMGHRGSSDGTVKLTRTTKITGKGQIYFVNKFKGKDKAS